MKPFKRVLLLISMLLTCLQAEKLFVVQREDSSLAVINNNKVTHTVSHMRNMNHGIVKFYNKDAYVISRDGYVIRFNPQTYEVINEYKTSKSAIGFVINEHYVAVANYDDQSVDILTRDLQPIKKIKTGSRNVGIKIYKDFLIFSQMDKDTISVYEDQTHGTKTPLFTLYKEFHDVGELPFDAMIQDEKYIAGFFKSQYFGVVDLKTMRYKKIDIFLNKERQRVLKVPHFGFWSLSHKQIFIPAVGDNKVLVYDNEFNFMNNITTKGLPVFTSLSPTKEYLAVTFSGKDFPTIQIIDTKTLKIIHTFEFDGKVLHVRWSNTKNELYVSVNDSNKVAVINTKKWSVEHNITQVKKPSGIFIYEEKNNE
ncbi:cytochrome D1 domain-containing protein [Candidatus Marinarcus aquaticus]|uniref:Nitrite reductase n=1 Tax=Candidatus Marinarcus aquaticus TaxID=2044504 RepID=A0A4Q0XQ14_9BACT|nr:cytochrome D1 domain-containing protein [Candidatus Marinarcus aquaticus]RXJ57604.1 nitrite reductase [Candidatus Marinarcus aquaticus]